MLLNKCKNLTEEEVSQSEEKKVFLFDLIANMDI